MSVEIAGQPIQPSTSSMNHVWKILADYHLRDRETSRFLQNGVGLNVSPGVNTTNQQYCITNWTPGFLTSCQPEVIDTGALGDVSIVIKLSNAQPLILSGTAAGADYQLDKLEFSIDIISFDDNGRYYKMIEDLLNSGKPIEIPYQYWVIKHISRANQFTSKGFK
jgi:hypothetical protein